MEVFRPLELKDKEQVIEICKSIWDGDDYIPNIYEDWINDSDSYFIGLFDDDLLIGFGRLASHGDGNYWLEGLRKNHKLNIKGVGKKIANYLIKIAMDNECQSLKFSTYFDNIESISLNEKIGFARIKEWSYLDLDLTENPPENLDVTQEFVDQVSFQDFKNYILKSNFLSEMSGFLCEGWKVYNVNDSYLQNLYDKSQHIALIKDNKIQAMSVEVIDSDKNIFLSFFDFSHAEFCPLMMNKLISQAKEANQNIISIIVPTHERVDCLAKFSFKSWEQKNDFYLYEYKGL